MIVVQPSHNWVRKLRRFVCPPRVERCDLCRADLTAEHPHLVEIASRRLLCACRNRAAAVARRSEGLYRRVPQRAQVLRDFRLADAEWDALQIPIGLAFVFHSTPDGRAVAFYPGPAGATESLLNLDGWSQLLAHNPVLASLKPDVEALLVNRTNGQREYFRVPIDRCYALVGLIRRHWRGLSGGSEAWEAIGQFFASLRRHAAGAPGGWAHG